MSVATVNKFAILNDDPEDGAGSKALPPKPAPTKVVVEPTPKKRDNERQTAQSRSGRYYKRGGAPAPATTATDGEGLTAPPTNEGRRFDRTEGRPDRGRGRGRGRGGDGPRRGRAFDKESQTGKIDTEKTVNQGWGADTGDAELIAEVQGEQDAQKDAAADGWGAPAADADAWGGASGDAPAAAASGEDAEKEGARRRREEEEEEDNTMTLEEYLAKKKADESSAIPKLEGRTVETSEFKDAVQLTREESEEVYFAGKTKSTPKAKAKKEEKVFISIDAPPVQREGGRGRGGRSGRGGDRGGRARGGGGDRGGRGRGGDRNNAPRRGGTSSANVDVDDVSAFPSLS